MVGEVKAAQEQTYDALLLRMLVRKSLRKSSRFELGDARRALTRVAGIWPGEPTDLMRVAAVSRHVDVNIDSLWGQIPERLRAMAATAEPWSVPDAAATADLAQLVIFEGLDYMAVCRPFLDPDLRMRSLLTRRDDINALTASMRWTSMLRLELRAPEDSLRSWQKHTKSIAENPQSWDVSEYDNTLNIRGSLEYYCSLLTGAAQTKWRELIEPADEVFRAATEIQAAPVMLEFRQGRAEGWWYYRSPPDVDWAASRVSLRAHRWFADEHPGGLRSFLDVRRWAIRENGLLVLTDAELDGWRASVSRQADAEQRRGKPGYWTDLFDKADAERRRRPVDRRDS